MRRSGRTTRIIDAAIQELFTKGQVTLVDHHFEASGLDTPDEANERATKFAFKTLVDRLMHEHGNFNKFHIDEKTFTIIKLIS